MEYLEMTRPDKAGIGASAICNDIEYIEFIDKTLLTVKTRIVVGKYLKERFAETISGAREAGVNVDLFAAHEVLDAADLGEMVRIDLKNRRGLPENPRWESQPNTADGNQGAV